jgi:hypothetical protein
MEDTSSDASNGTSDGDEECEEEQGPDVVLDVVFHPRPLKVMHNTAEDEKHRYWCGCLPGREPADDLVEDEMQKHSSGWWIVLRLRKREQVSREFNPSSSSVDHLERTSIITTQQIEDVLSIGTYPRIAQKRPQPRVESTTQPVLLPLPPIVMTTTGTWSILSVIGPVECISTVCTIQTYWSKSSHRGIFGKIARGEAISRLLSISNYVNWELVLNINSSSLAPPMSHIQKPVTTTVTI